MSEPTISDEMVDAYVRAIFTGWYIEMKGEELRQDVRAGLAAVVPLIRAQVLREVADRRHCIDRSRLPMTVFGGVQIPYCICGMVWYENGCTPRQQLILDAATASIPLPPVSDETREHSGMGGPPVPAGWCTWHQMTDCAGAAPECREARAELDDAANTTTLVTVDPADLLTVLDQRNGHHYHERPGVWLPPADPISEGEADRG